MNKRILCVILTLIMLVSLVPAGAISASAASLSASEKAITVLKQLEGYSKYCTNGYTGYGTLCTKTGNHAKHVTTEKEADKALRAELKDLSAAVNSFASKNGLSLNQNQHDALVLFSFENGTAWTTGSGDFQTAVKTGKRGSDFLSAICWWDSSTNDDNRRMIEANMYLNGAYSSVAPSRFIRVFYDVNAEGENAKEIMPEAGYQYYDTNERPTPDIVPERDGYKFLGWYSQKAAGYQVTSLSYNTTLYAHWQAEDNEPAADKGVSSPKENNLNWDKSVSNAVRLYQYESYYYVKYNAKKDSTVIVYKKASEKAEVRGKLTRGDKIVRLGAVGEWTEIQWDKKTGWIKTEDVAIGRDFDKSDLSVKGLLHISRDYIDSNNVRWGKVTTAEKLYSDGVKIAEATYDEDKKMSPVVLAGSFAKDKKTVTLEGEYWINLGEAKFNNGISNTGSSDSYSMDVLVTVTNTYLRVRSSAKATASEVGKLYLGEQVRIVNTASSNGSLWGQIADEDGDGKCEGWIALVYTNYEDVKGNSQPVLSYNVIATATIVSPINGYVNVRSAAGTDNQIVGALPYESRVDLYEITYVNGIRWGRYSGGWFCLSYADVEGVNMDDFNTNSNVLAYAFVGDLESKNYVFEKPSLDAPIVESEKIAFKNNRTISNLTTDADGNTWGKISEGWVAVSDKNGDPVYKDDVKISVNLDVAKYYTVVNGVTVRTSPSTSADRVNNLVKGVEFNVNESKQIIVVGETIWGYADKVGEDNKTYSGWINLASKYVARGDAPTSGESSNKDDVDTGLVGTIVGADKVNVRIHHATYSKILGKIARGTTVKILDEKDGWYKIDYDVDNNSETDSWVVDTYVEVSKASANTGSSSNGSTGTGSAAIETGLGIVANTYTGVNVRTAPGTGNPAVGKLLAGSAVEILEVTTYGASKWGRVAEGWICMDYVTMVDNYEILGALTGNNGSSSGNSSSTSEVAIYTGKTTQQVNIRKTTSLDADIVRTVEAGTNVTLHEILTVTETETSDPTYNGNSSSTTTTTTTSYWARVNDGYIYNPAAHLELDTLDEATYTVTGYDTLNVRTTPGTDGNVEYRLEKGDQVIVTKLAIINGTVWGFIEGETAKRVAIDEEGEVYEEIEWKGDGWISLAYCTKGVVVIQNQNQNQNNGNTGNNNVDQKPIIGAGSSTGGFVNNSTGYRYTGKVINTNSVNVRATASTTATITTTLSSGAALVIYETTIAENMAWGRCDAGWVYLYYVDLTPVVGGAVDARVVYNDNTIAYTDMNCSDVAGTYSRMSVVDIYEIVGKMARCELGWVNVDNLL